jgi:hypothetical protein
MFFYNEDGSTVADSSVAEIRERLETMRNLMGPSWLQTLQSPSASGILPSQPSEQDSSQGQPFDGSQGQSSDSNTSHEQQSPVNGSQGQTSAFSNNQEQPMGCVKPHVVDIECNEPVNKHTEDSVNHTLRENTGKIVIDIIWLNSYCS